MVDATRGFRAYAHRGGALEAPENSMTAFTRAWDLGFTYFETDIRPTRDGVAVLHHDADLDRTTDGQGPVRNRSWHEVRALRHTDGTPPLRLEELLEAFPGTHVTLDAKESGSVLALVDAVRRCGAEARVCVASFSPRRLALARRLLPYPTESSAHPGEVLSLRTRSVRASSGTLPHSASISPLRIQVPEQAWGIRFARADFLDGAHRRGLAVDIWTVNDAARMRALIDLGVDGIMTDAPTVLRDVLRERGIPAAIR